MPDYNYIDNTIVYKVDSIDDITIGLNRVLLTPIIDTSSTKGGIQLLNDWDDFKCATRILRVVKKPSFLAIKGNDCFTEKDIHALDWSTEIEIEENDHVWVDPVSVILNKNTKTSTHSFICDGIPYFTVPYNHLILAKRNWKFIPLNGYVLIEEKFKEVSCGAYKKKVLDEEGIVFAAGRPNDFYYNRNETDDIEVHKGDIVHCPKHRIYLEDDLFRTLPKLIFCQRRRIEYVMGEEVKKILPLKVWIKRDQKTTVEGSSVIKLSAESEKPTTGVVVNLGHIPEKYEIEGLKIGSKVRFSPHAREIVEDGETFVVTEIDKLEWWNG